MIRLKPACALAAFGALWSASAPLAQAATATGTFSATAVISAACTVSAANLSFGTYSPAAAAALTGNSTISVFCTSGTPYTVALNVGTGGGTFAQRKLANGANLLNYNLYTSAALTAIWGDGSASTSTVAGTGVGILTANPVVVYGSIPISQDLPTGTYTSTITVTVNY